MSAKGGLLSMACRAQRLLAEVLRAGDLAVDLTAGNGYDSCFLYRAVGPGGRVLAFDIQPAALEKTAEGLTAAGARVFGPYREPFGALSEPGGYLIHGCHARLREFLAVPAAAIIANLGYLPGGAKSLATVRATTLQAMEQALSVLAPGGRLAVVAYVGHSGGRAEADGVAELFSALPAAHWNVLEALAANRPTAPILLVAEKRPERPEA